MKFRLIILTILVVFLLVGCQLATINQNVNNQLVEPLEIKETQEEPEVISTSEVEKEAVEIKKPEIPQTLDYPVPFVSQAPYAIWDELHKEACEEAAIILVAKYFKNEPLTAHTMEQAILDLVKWEEVNGYKIDINAQEATEILDSYFGLKAELITEVTIERIKKELVSGKLIIIPAAGRELGNPYFRTPGPIYHMLVIRGYNQTEFITNDVGTKRGDGFKYKYQKLLDAVHDWNHQLAEGGMTDEEMEQGRKVMITVEK